MSVEEKVEARADGDAVVGEKKKRTDDDDALTKSLAGPTEEKLRFPREKSPFYRFAIKNTVCF